MRKIFFRGKRVDNGKWVCGYYVLRKRPYFKDKGANFEHIICDNLVIDDFNDKQFVDTIPITYSVDPETIGQYTGLTDMNGNKIFEKDIIHIGRYTGIVKWDNDSARFALYQKDVISMISGFNADTMNMALVIGNIHDTPELLKAGEMP